MARSSIYVIDHFGKSLTNGHQLSTAYQRVRTSPRLLQDAITFTIVFRSSFEIKTAGQTLIEFADGRLKSCSLNPWKKRSRGVRDEDFTLPTRRMPYQNPHKRLGFSGLF